MCMMIRVVIRIIWRRVRSCASKPFWCYFPILKPQYSLGYTKKLSDTAILNCQLDYYVTICWWRAFLLHIYTGICWIVFISLLFSDVESLMFRLTHHLNKIWAESSYSWLFLCDILKVCSCSVLKEYFKLLNRLYDITWCGWVYA
jgi:hypothetical protein